MVVRESELDRVFHALADPTRRDIVSRCLHEPLSVSGLAAGYAMSFAAVQKHVAVLERAGLVRKRRRGREQLVNTEHRSIELAQRALGDYETTWRGRVGRMSALLDRDLSDDPEGESTWR